VASCYGSMSLVGRMALPNRVPCAPWLAAAYIDIVVAVAVVVAVVVVAASGADIVASPVDVDDVDDVDAAVE
jgi:hypothetical protein